MLTTYVCGFFWPQTGIYRRNISTFLVFLGISAINDLFALGKAVAIDSFGSRKSVERNPYQAWPPSLKAALPDP